MQSSTSERQKEIIDLIRQGKTTKEMASALFLSPSTIKWHIRNILTKHNARNRTALVTKITNKTNLSSPEPMPNGGQGDMWLLVLKDMEERRQVGIKKYNQPLRAFDGRRPLIDAYQELLDLCVYLRKEIRERYGA